MYIKYILQLSWLLLLLLLCSHGLEKKTYCCIKYIHTSYLGTIIHEHYYDNNYSSFDVGEAQLQRWDEISLRSVLVKSETHATRNCLNTWLYIIATKARVFFFFFNVYTLYFLARFWLSVSHRWQRSFVFCHDINRPTLTRRHMTLQHNII